MNLLRSIKGDRIIWLTVIILFAFSVMTVFSSGTYLALTRYGGSMGGVLTKQVGMVAIGLVMMFLAHLLDYRYYSRIAQILFWLSLLGLGFTMVTGVSINSGQRWIDIPFIGLTFQSSDFAKMALIMYLARMLSKRQDDIKTFERGFWPLIWPVVIICAFIAPADLSTAAVLFLTSVLLLFIGRVNMFYIGGLIGVVVAAGLLGYGTLKTIPDENLPGRLSTWKARIERFGADDEPVPYQVEQARIAIARGGLLPSGPGNSVQRNYLPGAYNDFIFAIIIEEYGLLGGLFVVFLYLVLLYRAVLLVVKAPKAFGALLGVGLTLSIVIQAFVNMAVAVGLLPVTGLTLPFVSWGGTSILFTSIAMGIVLSVSASIERTEEREMGDDARSADELEDHLTEDFATA